MMFKIYAFSEAGSWSAEADSLGQAHQVAEAFERRGLPVRIYEQSENQAGDTIETLISGSEESLT